MRRGLRLAIDSSLRVWLVDQLTAWPRHSDTRVAADVFGRVAGSHLRPYMLTKARPSAKRVTIATRRVLTDPWNPVAGSFRLADAMVLRGLHDPLVLPNPYTELHKRHRLADATVTVTKDAPVQRHLDWLELELELELEREDEIRVPASAWID